MGYEDDGDVQNDIQRNNMISLPTCDSYFEFVNYAVAYHVNAAFCEEDMFRKRTAEMY